MRMVNGLIFLLLGMAVFVTYLNKQRGLFKNNIFVLFIEEHLYVIGILFAANLISFALTYSQQLSEIYVEKGKYGEEEQLIPFELRKGDSSTEIALNVNARKFTQEELEKRVSEAFIFLDENLKGDNVSLSKVRTALDCSLDVEQFPFDIELESEDYAILDGDGNVHNEEKNLLNLGYTKEEIEEGIPLNITVTLWYGEKSFKKVYPLVIWKEKQGELEKVFAETEKLLQEEEQKAIYEEGFYIPAMSEGVAIVRLDKEKITSLQVLIAGIVLAGLLILREKENQKAEEKERTNMLIRSYPWFVNEMVLLLGAGMQVRNIFAVIIRDTEGNEHDHRKPLIDELKVAMHAMELGMPEEQAYYQLGRRLKLLCYIKLMTLLEQNVKRGTKGLTTIFEQEELSALEERKNLAKRYGEEAGTKLLGPMILLLMVILLMIMIPAFWGIM